MILFKASSKSSIYARLLFSVAVLCLLSTVTGCSDDEDPAEIVPNPGSEIYFTKSLDFTSESDESILSFTTNKDWTIEVSQSGGDVSWCTVFPAKGKAGENEVLVKVAENTGTDDRNATLILTAKELTNRIVVTQKQKDAITLTTAKFEVDKNGGDIEVEVKANVSYEVIIPEQYQSWIHKRTIRPDKCVFSIGKSEEYDKREGEIVFQSGDLKETLKVYQTGGGVLLLSKNEYTVSDKGEQIAVELKSNFDFEVKMPQVDWITTTVTRSVSSHTLYYTIDTNETYDKREAEIIYYDRTNKSLADTLKIVQVQKDAILLSQKEYSVGCNEEFIDVEVNANVDFTIQIPNSCASWINMVENPTSRGLVSHKISFKISENATDKERVGEIVVSDKKGNLSESVIVRQAEAAFITLPIHKYDIGYKGQIIEIAVSSNIHYAYKMSADCDWIVKTGKPTTRGVTTDLLYFMVHSNETCTSRKAEIIFYSEDDEVEERKVDITQKGVPFQFTNGIFTTDLGVTSDKDKLLLKQLLLDNNIDLSSIKEVCLYGELMDSDYDFLNVLSSAHNLTHIDLSNSSIWKIPQYAFQGCGKLETIVFPMGLRVISHYAFKRCSRLKNVILPDGLTSLSMGIFRECLSLEKITIPASVTSIGNQCFYICGVKEVHCKGVVPPKLDHEAFDGEYDSMKIYVPRGTKLAYQMASVWCFFENIIEE